MDHVRRGDIRWVELGDNARPGEAGFMRPGLIVSSNRMPAGAPVIIVPLTTTPRAYPTVIEIESGLPRVSYAQCEQVRAVARSRIGGRITSVDSTVMARVNIILKRILDL